MRKFLKILLYTLGSIIVLLLLIVVYLQTPWGKEMVRKQAMKFLTKKLNTEIVIRKIDYSLPKSLDLQGVLLIDKNKDTLFTLGELSVDMQMLALIRSEVKVNKVVLTDVYANVYRNAPDTDFNYQFIIDAFSSPPDTTAKVDAADTNASNMVVEVKRVELNNIRLRYHDESGGTFFDLDLKSMLLRPRKIDVSNLAFEVNEFSVNGLRSAFASDTSYLPPDPDTATGTPKLKIILDKLNLKDVGFAFDNRRDSLHFDVLAGSLTGKLDSFNLATSRVAVSNLALENTNSTFVIGKNKKSNAAPAAVDSTDTASSNWLITAGNLMLKQVNFAMDNNNAPRLSQGIDYSHLDIKNFSLNAENAYYTSDSVSANLKHLALTERSGLAIIELRSNFAYYDQGAKLNDLYLQTPGTIIRDNIAVSYPSRETLSKDLGSMYTEISLKDSRVAMNDVLIFMPASQRKTMQSYAGQSIQLAGQIKGHLSRLTLNDLYVAGLRNTEVRLSGTLNGLPEADKLNYDLNIAKLYSTYHDISPFIPASVQQQINMPSWFSITGKIAGTTTAYHPDLKIQTSDGDLSVNGQVDMSAGTGHEKYDISFATSDLNVGKIIRRDSLIGHLTMTGKATGTSFDINTMNATVNGRVASMGFKGYNYQSVNLDATIANKIADIELRSQDPNAELVASAKVDLNGKDPAVKGVIDIANLNPYALHFVNDSLQLHGKMWIDFSSLSPRYPIGSFVWEDPEVRMGSEVFNLDSVSVSSAPSGDSVQNIVFNISNILNGTLTGHIPLTEIGNAALAHINKYYKLSDTITNAPLQYDMKLDARVNNHPLIHRFVPQLNNFRSLSLAALLSPDDFKVDAYTQKVGYGTNLIDSLRLGINEANGLLNYSVGAQKLTSGTSITLWDPNVKGFLRNDSLYAKAGISDSLEEERFALGASMSLNSDSLTYIHLFPGLKFDYNTWNVNPANTIAFGSGGFFINNFDISKNNESITINSATPSTFNSPLNIAINNFSIGNITSMISTGDTLLAEGVLNLKGTVDLRDSTPMIDADLKISKLTFMNQELGDLAAKAHNENSNTYNAWLQLTQNANDLVVDGKYYLEPVSGNNLDFDVNINALSLASVEGLAANSIRNSAGFIRGRLALQGTIEKPVINGELRTDSLYTVVSMLNTSFLMKNEHITFNNRGIGFNNFTLTDANRQEATINGMVRTTDYRNYDLNLAFKADSVMVMNSTQEDYESLYGRLLISTNLSILNTPQNPTITGNIRIHDSTKAFYALVDKAPGEESDEGIVTFVDGRDTTKNYYAIDTALQKAMFVTGNGAQINVNVDVDKSANFNVIVDPSTGDRLSVSGEASLNTSVGAGGVVGLTGVYELDRGYYELHYNFLKRKFSIKSGSTVLLAGDPLEANVDIQAVYDANTAPYELVEKQISDPGQLVYFRQRLPFQVVMKIKGKVMKPEITFDIVLPEENSATADVTGVVQSKLQSIRNDPSQINKQVFALLILGRFIADDPFESNGGGGAEYMVRQNAARLLSQQLNQIADQLVKGVDLSIDLASQEDYSTGSKVNRTDLNISASKQMFNDRLTVTVGNDFQLEGQPTQNRQTSFIPGTLSADYKVTQDGRYSVRAYRQSQLQNIINGYVTETGVALRLRMEYNSFRQIFRNRKKLREIRRREREEREQTPPKDDKVSIAG